ncbi:MAG: dihydroorotate dehydrogenase electron transfer subunit [Dehalococcoidia bacterium]|nr:dihydroorotate dehydrogenase electron transfer subunit [Dehalococcoidia bacterium]
MNNKSCPVQSNREILPSTHLMWVDAPQLAATARPGQFAMLRCCDNVERMLRRPLTMHQVDGSRVAFLYRVMGEGTRWLSARSEGQPVDILGPLGNGFTVNEQSRRLLLVAGGMGFAPLRFLADKAMAEGHEVTLLIGAKAANALYPAELIPKGLEVIAVTEDGSAGDRGLVTQFLGRYVEAANQVFACGPEPMYRALLPGRDSWPAGLRAQVSLEVRMGCGVGACLSCTIRTKSGPRHVCKDGPVFDLDDVLWGETPVCAL